MGSMVCIHCRSIRMGMVHWRFQQTQAYEEERRDPRARTATTEIQRLTREC